MIVIIAYEDLDPDGVEYSNQSARDFSDEYFGKDVKGVRNLYADGSMPDGYTPEGDYARNSAGDLVEGTTHSLGLGKGSDVYLYKSSFTSKWP